MSAHQLIKVGGLGGELDPAAALEVAVDRFVLDDPLYRIDRGVVGPIERPGPLESEALH